MALPTSSTYASPISLATAYLEVEGSALANGSDITDTLIALADASTDGTLYFQVPNSAWTLNCGPINFSTYGITHFGALESASAVSIALTGTGYNLWAFTTLTDLVIGTRTQAASRDDYKLTLVGSWDWATNRCDPYSIDNEALVYVTEQASSPTGSWYLRYHTRWPKLYAFSVVSLAMPAKGPDAIYVSGTHIGGGAGLSRMRGDIYWEDAYFSDPCGYIRGWTGASDGATATTGSATRAGCRMVINTGRMLGAMTLQYGGMYWDGGTFGAAGTATCGYGSASTDPFVVSIKDHGWSGPEAADWGSYSAGVAIDDHPVAMQWQFKMDGMGGVEEAEHRWIKVVNDNQYAGTAGMTAVFVENNTRDDGGSSAAWSSHVIWTLVNVDGMVENQTPGDPVPVGWAVGFDDNRMHHMTYRGDGVNPASIGPTWRSDYLKLHYYDTLEYAQVFCANIEPWLGDHTGYAHGSYNTLRNVVFRAAGKLSVSLSDYVTSTTGNTATNLKFLGTARQIINVAAGAQLTIANLEAPSGSTIVVGTGATVTLNGNSLGAGTHTLTSSTQYKTGDWPLTDDDVPELPTINVYWAGLLLLESATQAEVFSRPDADVATGSWTAVPAGSLYAAIDEGREAGSDVDYVYTTVPSSTMVVSLSALDDPRVDTGHLFRYRGRGKYTISLLQGSTEISSWTETDADWTTHERMLSASAAASISDYSDLRVMVVSGS